MRLFLRIAGLVIMTVLLALMIGPYQEIEETSRIWDKAAHFVAFGLILFQAGFLSTYVVPSDEGPHRKYYALTAAGRDQLNRSAKGWRTFAHTMDALLDERGVAA